MCSRKRYYMFARAQHSLTLDMITRKRCLINAKYNSRTSFH